MHTLKNNILHVKLKPIGAELCSITSVKNNTEFMWQADPNIWGSHAPNLFPIIGAMKDDSYTYNGKLYKMTKHGFVRKNDTFSIKNKTETSITFSLTSNDELYKLYPFLFQFEITYTLTDNILTVNHTIKNTDKKVMYFSVGGHPAFNCPINSNEVYSDYFLEFETEESSESYLLNMANGLVTNTTKPVFIDGNKIRLHENLFNDDALIFKDLKSRKVALKHNTKGTILSLNFNNFSYLGIWAKPNAPYVCIEPWLGIADVENTNQKIEDKEGILSLNAGTIFNANYSIEIDQRHLV